jgi:two-component system phosphate regulon sensor histidine kinase PhoR
VRDILAPGGRVLQLHAAPLAGGATVVVLLDVTEARSLERMRREFVANASHELRTPVAAIQAVAETLAGSPTMSPADRARFERILLSHAQRLSRLVSDLLDLSRAEAAAPRPELRPIRLAAPLASAIAAVRERAEAKQLRIEERLPPELPPVDADDSALEQVLVNLLDNAVKYTPAGGRVQVRAAPEHSRVRIEVEDNGVGIPAEHLPRIFERFYLVDPARSRELGGTGLGLAIVKHLVQAQGGEVGVSSTVGTGSTFWVTLPIASS